MQQQEFLTKVMPIKDKLYRMAKRLLVSREEAEDATQEVLLKLWSKNENIKKYNSVEAFAMTMTKNYCLDRLKSKQAGNLKLVHSNYQDEAQSIEKKIEAADSVAWVDRIIADLPEQQRILVQLRDVEEYGYDEIAQMTQMKPTAIRVALSRARKSIREKLMEKHSYGT